MLLFTQARRLLGGPPRASLLAVLALLAALLAGGACGFGTPAAAPIPLPTPAPLPRPTAEPPASVAAWYLAAQAGNEEKVRIRADLTQPEIDRIRRVVERRYPKLAVDWSRGSDASLFQTTADEIRAGTANWDIYIGDSGPTLALARAALRWTPPEGRNVRPELIDGEGGWYAMAATYHVMQYSSEQVPPAAVPRAYEMLQDPGYLGRLAIEDQSLVWLKGLIETRGQERTAALIQALAQQGVTFRGDARSLVAFVTAGEHAVAIDTRLDAVERDKRSGGKTGWAAVEPVLVQPLAMVVSASTDRPNATKVVANLLLSLDVQEILAEHGRVPSRADADSEPQSPVRGLRTQVVLPPDSARERELRALWSELWGRR
ncbi:MAG: ABC transporter substrate-binding protein [Chloroflexi bacterium]|nr:ABC transporter substrate-binding protein [Chloroflexota bacterium]